MNRTGILLVLLAASVPAHTTEGISMWGCAPVGERRNVLFLAERGSTSYVKFSEQRIPSTVTTTDSAKQWSFGANSVVLGADGNATYHERGEVKSRFKCRLMEE